MTREKGIALFQVLVMTMVMSLIAIAFSYGAREQVAIGQSFADRVQAELDQRTARSRLLFAFFSRSTLQLSDNVVDGIRWNLRGKPFELLPDTWVRIQATSGLFSLDTTSEQRLELLFSRFGENGKAMLSAIRDWQDKDDQTRQGGAEKEYYQQFDFRQPRNGPMQDITELRAVKGITPEAYSYLAPLLSNYFTPSFNPALAPPELVKVVFDEGTSQQIIALQEQGAFSPQAWDQIAGMRVWDDVDIHPMSTFMIEIHTQVGDVQLVKRFDLELDAQNNREPLLILRNY